MTSNQPLSLSASRLAWLHLFAAFADRNG